MRTRRLGTTNLMVTEICLGTMTWGSSQNNEADAHAQMDYALEQGVTFWDTAELYPVNPVCTETYTLTEQYIGNWFKHSAKREQIVLASKVSGAGIPHIRQGAGFSRSGITAALEGSLTRLNTDYIDLYQLHWPNRGHYHMGKNWSFTPVESPKKALEDNILETIEILAEAIKDGKIRHYGLSNESAWGAMKFVQLAEQHNLPKPVSVQNEYGLMYRHHDTDFAEVSMYEGISLLPYTALAAGWLSGKYYGGKKPEGARFTLGPDKFKSTQRITPQAQKAADAYVDVARKHGLDPAQMAIAWTLTRPFVASTIIGATSMAQLKTDIGARDVVLSAEVLADLEAVRREWPMPY